MTTAIQLEARQGRYDTALALGVVLVTIVLLVDAVVVRLGGRSGKGGVRCCSASTA